MKKIVSIVLCLVLLSLNQLCFASKENIFDFDILSCNEIKISYYNGGEFSYPTMPGYYNYVTIDNEEIKEILNCISDINYIPFGGGFGGAGGEHLTIYVNGVEAVHFVVGVEMCYIDGKIYEFGMEEYRKLEDLVFEYRTKNDIKVYFNNERIKFYNSPVIMNDRTLVPAESISKVLGLEANWGGDKVIFKKENQFLVIYTEDDYIDEYGSRKPIDIGGRLIDEIAMVPVRVLAESYGFTVKWENNSVYIMSE